MKKVIGVISQGASLARNITCFCQRVHIVRLFEPEQTQQDATEVNGWFLCLRFPVDIMQSCCHSELVIVLKTVKLLSGLQHPRNVLHIYTHYIKVHYVILLMYNSILSGCHSKFWKSGFFIQNEANELSRCTCNVGQ